LDEGFIAKADIPETDGYKPATTNFIDNLYYDSKKPLDYIEGFKIGNRD
jgi:nitrate/nitrite transport system substrate-binding protein